MGCLAAPVRFLGLVALLALIAVAWLYRDHLAGEVNRLLGSSEIEDAATGRPGSRALLSARAKIDSLNGWRADSVVLTPSEVASMIGSGLDPTLRAQLDSLQVELQEGSIGLRANLATARLPRELVGPLAIALRDREPVEAAGPLEVTGPQRAEWVVRSFRIRNIPIPQDAVPRLVSKALGDADRETVPVRIPEGIEEIRIRPSGATLIGTRRS